MTADPSTSNPTHDAVAPAGVDRVPWLLTPGPLSTAPEVRHAMLRDWGSWDSDFRALTAHVRSELLSISGANPEKFACVPMQGSGTFVVEAMLGSLIPSDGHVLVLSNGAYGKRIATTLTYLGRRHQVLDKGDYLPPRGEEVAQRLDADPSITHVVVVHCETSSGILNPVDEIGAVVKSRGRKYLIDSMSAFGALPITPDTAHFDALVSSANKCIEGVPGFGFVIARNEELDAARGRSHSLSLDLHAQWSHLENTGQWRFTPPTHALAAFAEALRLHRSGGGAPGRLKRYQRQCNTLISGMRAAGFETLLTAPWLSPIIVTFFTPADPKFSFDSFYDYLKTDGYIIYPGKLTVVDSFRIGCIGALDDSVMPGVVAAARGALRRLGVLSAAPPASALQERLRLSA